MKFITFIGTQRSGSNLLRVMLNQLSGVSAPHPPHILKTFYPLLPSYGDLNNDANFQLLVNDICRWVNGNPVPWGDFKADSEKILSLCKQRTLPEVFSKVYIEKAKHDGAEFWCCKSMENVYYLPELEASGLNPFYIYLFRDGRDVALSFKKIIVGPKHVYNLAAKWHEEQQLSIQLSKSVDPSRIISIKYEDFIRQPHAIMEELCAKLGIPFTESVFDYMGSSESKAAAESGKMWTNLLKPVMNDNFNKFWNEMTDEDIRIFESVAGSSLQALGYELVFKNSEKLSFTKEQIAEFEKSDVLLRKQMVEQTDAQEKEHRRPQEILLKEIQSRPKAGVTPA